MTTPWPGTDRRSASIPQGLGHAATSAWWHRLTMRFSGRVRILKWPVTVHRRQMMPRKDARPSRQQEPQRRPAPHAEPWPFLCCCFVVTTVSGFNFHPDTMYDLVGLSFSELCNRLHIQCQNIFITSKSDPVPRTANAAQPSN